MYVTIASITHQLQFTPRQEQRVQALLAGRAIDPYHYYASDVLDACRRIEREDGWTTMVEYEEVLRLAVASGLVALQASMLWTTLEGCRWRCGHYAMVDVIEALADAESGGWGMVP